MKEIRIEVPDNQVEVLSDFVSSTNVKTTEIDLLGPNHLFIMQVEDNRSNNLLHELKARGVGTVFGTIAVYPINVYLDATVRQNKIEKSSAANIEEILANIEDSAIISGTYLALVILSGALAAFGLLEDSVVIIIGSMIVAPLMGPIALTSIGILLPQRGLFQKGVLAETIGIVLTVGIGFLVGIVVSPADPSEEMALRADANSLNIVFAVVSAIAAGVIISKGQSLSIVGVAIAASLAPPAAAIGLYLSLGADHYNDAQLAAVLLLINVLAINASCSIMFIIFRLPAKAGISLRRATRAQKLSQLATAIVLIAFIILSAFLIQAELSGG